MVFSATCRAPNGSSTVDVVATVKPHFRRFDLGNHNTTAPTRRLERPVAHPRHKLCSLSSSFGSFLAQLAPTTSLMQNRSAFVPAVAMPVAASPAATALCPTRPAPFFSSMAFGTPLPARIAPPPHFSNIRMDVTVVVGDSEPIEGALRRFKKEVTKSGHLFELRRRRYFETNTEKRIRKAANARRKARMSRNSARQSQRQNF